MNTEHTHVNRNVPVIIFSTDHGYVFYLEAREIEILLHNLMYLLFGHT